MAYKLCFTFFRCVVENKVLHSSLFSCLQVSAILNLPVHILSILFFFLLLKLYWKGTSNFSASGCCPSTCGCSPASFHMPFLLN